MSLSKLGKLNSFFGKHHSSESREKIRLAKVGRCLSPEHRGKLCLARVGKTPALGHRDTVDQKLRKRLAKLGEKNPRWKGGCNYVYPAEFSLELRHKIRHDWGFCCALCGLPQGRTMLDIHHIDGNKNNNCEANLVPLHRKCHMTVEGGDLVGYQLYFEDLQNQRGL